MPTLKILFTEPQIAKKVKDLANQINNDYAGKSLVMVAILKGSFVFLADLIRKINLPLELDFIQIASYGNKTYSKGKPKITKKLGINIKDKDVLIVEDIIDTGYTLGFLLNELKKQGAKSVGTCVLLDKTARRKIKTTINYTGFKVADGFVVGYGLDFSEKYRELPVIAELRD